MTPEERLAKLLDDRDEEIARLSDMVEELKDRLEGHEERGRQRR